MPRSKRQPIRHRAPVPDRAGERVDAQVEEIRRLSGPLDIPDDLDAVLDRVGEARIVQIGEASHGTSDYYRWRAELTKRLIEEQGFSFVAVEGDWPDCADVNEWVTDDGDDRDARQVLGTFERWPTWMWANAEVADFLAWLHERNGDLPPEGRAGFHGLDVYSLWDSLRAVLRWLADNRPEALDQALSAMRCFEPYGEDPQRYAQAVRLVPESCEEDVVALLESVRADAPAGGRGPMTEFDARQNAEVVAGAERYYRTMVRGGGQSWNVRDVHMADTLDRLLRHHGDGSRGIVWAHNTHVGDARATDMATAGMVNLGQLARERHGDDEVVLVGLGSRRGTVVAGDHWGAPAQVLEVPDARAGSHEDLLHRAVGDRGLVVMPDDRTREEEGMTWPDTWRPHRAIGVVYHPARDPRGNWVPTVIGDRYDAFLYLDTTEALSPLQPAMVTGGEPETYPWST